MTKFATMNLQQQMAVLHRVGEKAAHAFDLEPLGPLRLLNFRENAVYRLDDERSGRPFALRVHRANYQTEASIRSELCMGDILSKAGIPTPLGVPASNGNLIMRIDDDELDAPRYCSLLSWIDGVPMDEESDPVGTWEKLGELNAKVHNVFQSTVLPDDFERQVWDEHGLIGETCIWGDYADLPALSTDDKALLDKAADQLRGALQSFGKDAARYGLIHADLMPSNVLVDGEVLNIIDFDDSGFGWHLYELATSLFMQELDDIRPRLIEAWVKGYRSHRPLEEADLTMLPAFIMARRLKIMGWMVSRQETPIVEELGSILTETCLHLAADYIAEGRT